MLGVEESLAVEFENAQLRVDNTFAARPVLAIHDVGAPQIGELRTLLEERRDKNRSSRGGALQCRDCPHVRDEGAAVQQVVFLGIDSPRIRIGEPPEELPISLRASRKGGSMRALRRRRPSATVGLICPPHV
jgi:hypothetical protein